MARGECVSSSLLVSSTITSSPPRYLRGGFWRAFEHVLPDVVVFLGDHLDEGSVATDPQYQRYVDRFRSIFVVPRNTKVRLESSSFHPCPINCTKNLAKFS